VSPLEARALPGDALLADASEQVTEAITIHAPPEAVWPWLVQMGADRAGFYAIDFFDRQGEPSAREIHHAWQSLRVGERVLVSRGTGEGLDVLELEPQRLLVLGGLFDPDAGVQLDFYVERPAVYWQATWAFVLTPRADGSTELVTRARVALSRGEQRHALWVCPVHRLMERAQLRNLAERAEGRLAQNTLDDVVSGVKGALRIGLGLATPFLRRARSHHGLDPQIATRVYPGDERVPAPDWAYTHGVIIDAPLGEVWPWVAQLGVDRGGLYSYQWLENLVGCGVRNAETVHPEWQARRGDGLLLHPKQPPLPVADVVPESYLLAHAPRDPAAFKAGRPWVEVSWLFMLEPLGPQTRLISRYRSACSRHLASRLAFGPALIEPISFAMDVRMLDGIKERAESARV
jgi:hypothetical protein